MRFISVFAQSYPFNRMIKLNDLDSAEIFEHVSTRVWALLRQELFEHVWGRNVVYFRTNTVFEVLARISCWPERLSLLATSIQRATSCPRWVVKRARCPEVSNGCSCWQLAWRTGPNALCPEHALQCVLTETEKRLQHSQQWVVRQNWNYRTMRAANGSRTKEVKRAALCKVFDIRTASSFGQSWCRF